MFPLSSPSTHRDSVGQDALITIPSPETSLECHADVPPVGLDDTSTIPLTPSPTPPPTHRWTDGQEMAFALTPAGAAVTCQLPEPPAGLVDVTMSSGTDEMSPTTS